MSTECESCKVLTEKLKKARNGGNNAIKAANRQKQALVKAMRALDKIANDIEATLNGEKK